MPNPQPFTVLSRARPRRVAFVVDPNSCPDGQLDAIFAANYDVWGGRYNPIIPASGGEIEGPFWSLMSFADPDIVYSYTDLSMECLDRLDAEIAPYSVLRHRDGVPGQPPNFYPTILREQVRASALLSAIFGDRKGFPFADPALLVNATPLSWPHRRLILRNFGLIDENVHPKPYPDGFPVVRMQSDWNDRMFFHALSGPADVIYPFQLAEAYSEFGEPHPDSDPYEFCILIGNDVQTWLYFWNRIFYLNSFRRAAVNTVCLPDDVLAQPGLAEFLRSFIERRLAHSGAQSIGVLSFCHGPEELLQMIAGLFDREKLDIRVSAATLDFGMLPSLSHGDLTFNEFRRNLVSRGTPVPIGQQQGTIPSLLVQPPMSVAPIAAGTWMIDLKAEYRPEKQQTYTNAKLWWKLPPVRGITRLFVRSSPGRINAHGSITIERQSPSAIEFEIPSDSSVLYYLVNGERRSPTKDDMRRSRSTRLYAVAERSDKANYANGVIELFGSLYHAGNFLQNHYWRSIVEHLSLRVRTREDQRLADIENKLRKNAEQLLAELDARNFSWLAHYILSEARQQHLRHIELKFEGLLKRFVEERTAYGNAHPEIGTPPTDEHSARDLMASLQHWTIRRVFLQGTKTRCRVCGTSEWREASELRPKMLCKGCESELNLLVEAPWFYKLNSVIQNAFAFHGVLPLISTLFDLLEDSHTSFLFEPGISLFEKWGGDASAEVDFACIADGKFFIGEVKTRSEEFTSVEIGRMAGLVRKIEPDAVVLACFYDQNDRLSMACEALRALLPDARSVVRPMKPHPQVFEPSLYC